MSKITFKDPFTCDGRLRPNAMPGVSKAKVAKVKQLMESALGGDQIASGMLSESLSTSDAIFSAAYLANLQFLPQFLELPRTWSRIAGVRQVADFDPVVLRGVFGEFQGLERQGVTGLNNPEGIAPIVPELSEYPYATIGNIESAYGQIHKRGFKVGHSWESQVNGRGAEFFAALPGEMLQVALDTEEWEVYTALVNGTGSGSQLTGGTIFTGETVVANAPISRNAVIRGLHELSVRTVNGRQVGRSSNGYALVVPLGAGPAVDFMLNQQIIQAQDGSFTLSVQDQFSTGDIDVVESQYVTGTNWYLLPKPGGLRRPVLELGRLRGHEVPELRVENATGTYIGRAAVSPFEGSFQNDAIDLRLRIAISGINWNDDFILWSTGAGA